VPKNSHYMLQPQSKKSAFKRRLRVLSIKRNGAVSGVASLLTTEHDPESSR